MLNNIIEKVTKDFSNEALQSPVLLNDLASMERYMAESYSGRIFVELIQNADDAYSTQVCLFEKNGNVYFANNGKSFDENDVLAISRSGSSTKKRGNGIGYRGIGFKSTTYLSNEILIYSDQTYFSFSKKLCSQMLDMPEENIPTVRIPILIKEIDKHISDTVNELISNNFTTIFVFKNAKINDLKDELSNITVGHFIFLNHVANCSINFTNFKKEFKISRKNMNDGTLVTFQNLNNEQWLVTSDYNKTSLAFKYENEKIVPCSSDEAVYHSYLPTLDKFLYPCKINGDFSTDPSRKHLHSDDLTDYVLKSASDMIVLLVKKLLLGELSLDYSRLLEIFMQPISYSKINNSLYSMIKYQLTNQTWLLLNDKKNISAAKYKCLPDWLENSEKNYIRTTSEIMNKNSLNKSTYKNIYEVDTFLKNFSKETYDIKDFVEMLKEDYLVSNLPKETLGKILGKIIKTQRTNSILSGEVIELKDIKVLTNKGLVTINDLAKNPEISIDTSIKEELYRTLSPNDLDFFINQQQIQQKKQVATETLTQKKENFSVNVSKKKSPITKWRSAEKQCVELETYFGNTAFDVSKQNVGYDIESTTPTGEKKYIEVKSINGEDTFSITNNEYTSAHQHGDNYYICLIEHSSNTFHATYIQNPLKEAQFEKRIRQWEWLCTDYSGEKFNIDL